MSQRIRATKTESKSLDLDQLVLNLPDNVDVIIKRIISVEQNEIPSKTIDGEQYIRRMNRVTFEDINGLRYVMMLKNAKMSEMRTLIKSLDLDQLIQINAKKETELTKRRYESRVFEIVSISPKEE